MPTKEKIDYCWHQPPVEIDQLELEIQNSYSYTNEINNEKKYTYYC